MYIILTPAQENAAAYDDQHQSRYLGEHEHVLNFSGGFDVPTVDESYETYIIFMHIDDDIIMINISTWRPLHSRYTYKSRRPPGVWPPGPGCRSLGRKVWSRSWRTSIPWWRWWWACTVQANRCKTTLIPDGRESVNYLDGIRQGRVWCG